MEKLIAKYQKQIETIDLHIESLTCLIRKKRKEGMSADEYYDATDELRVARAKTDVKRQALIQVIKDLEDYIETTL